MQNMMNTPSTILITGATGFTGRRLCHRLAQQGHTIRAVCRNESTLGDLQALPVTWFRGEVFDGALLEEAAQDVEYIFHMATLYRDGGASEDQHRRVHVDSTRLLAEAARRQPSFKRFIHVSTIGVHGHIEHIPADESAPFAPGDAYQRTKLDAELWLRQFAEGTDFPYTILRPAAIYGPDDDRLLKIFRMALKPLFPKIGKSRGLYHLIHVEDLVDILLRAATHPAARGEAFICGNPEPVTLEHFAATVADTFGHRLRLVPVPAAPLFLLADLCERVCAPLRLSPPIYRRRVAFFTKDRCFDTSKVRTLLEWSPRFSNEDGIRSTALAYRDAGKL